MTRATKMFWASIGATLSGVCVLAATDWRVWVWVPVFVVTAVAAVYQMGMTIAEDD